MKRIFTIVLFLLCFSVGFACTASLADSKDVLKQKTELQKDFQTAQTVVIENQILKLSETKLFKTDQHQVLQTFKYDSQNKNVLSQITEVAENLRICERWQNNKDNKNTIAGIKLKNPYDPCEAANSYRI